MPQSILMHIFVYIIAVDAVFSTDQAQAQKASLENSGQGQAQKAG